MISYDITYTSISVKNIHTTPKKKKTMETRIMKNLFNKNERISRDVKSQKACKQGWKAKLNKPLALHTIALNVSTQRSSSAV